ncbi:hypothetical protein CALVIDRAFT_565261 [Calocera viscosa TUFC12733]|uniref:Uncharacterized protein n=1 Tax=Calocera viscosa (strain TUFC12733) TaxID=1330018 RepID=A0A167KPB2_CALVF|nr:hypothetical protein CALVIDRAFT_565261 [Calocera viscosa TUFC12733]
MDTPPEVLDAPPPAYELSQTEFDTKLADAVHRSLTITPRPQQPQQPQPQPQPQQPQPQQQQQQVQPAQWVQEKQARDGLPSVQVTPPPTASLDGHQLQGGNSTGNGKGEEGFEEWDEEVFRANALRRVRSSGSGSGSEQASSEPYQPNGNGKDRSSTPTPATIAAPSLPAELKQEKRPSWYAEAGLSPSAGSSTAAAAAAAAAASPTRPENDKTPRRSPSGARAPATRNRSVRVLPSIPQGSASGPTSPIDGNGGGLQALVEGGEAWEGNGKERAVAAQEREEARWEKMAEKEKPSWYYEAGFDKLDRQLAAAASASASSSTAQQAPSQTEEAPPPHEAAPTPGSAQEHKEKEKERPSWYYEAGLDMVAGGGSGSVSSDPPPPPPAPAPAPVPAPEPMQEKERPSWYDEAGLGDSSKSSEAAGASSSSSAGAAASRPRSDTTTTVSSTASPAGPLLQWPSSASTSPAATLPPLGEEEAEYMDEAPPAFTPVAPPLPGPGIAITGGMGSRAAAGRGMSPPPPIGPYVSGSTSSRHQTMPPPASAPSHQQTFPVDVRAPNRYSMPAMSHAASMAGSSPGGAGATAFPARVGIQSTGQKQTFAPAGYSRRLQFNPSVAYGDEGQAGTVGAVGGGVGQESLYGNVHALYNSSVAAFLPKPAQPQYQTAAQAYAAQYAATSSSPESNARLSPVSMRRSPSASPSTSTQGTSLSNSTSPTPTYSSNPSSSPLPTPPAGASARPYDTALAESVGPVADSVKQMHQQAQANLNRYSMAPSVASSVGSTGSAASPPVPAYPPQLQYNPLNAYNPPQPAHHQPYPPPQQGFPGPGLVQSQSLYAIPGGPPRGYGQPAPAPGPQPGQMYPQPGYPPVQQQQQWGPPPPQGQQPVQGWQQGQGTAYRR